MGSLGEEELFKMVHDFIESESSSSISSHSSQLIPLNHQPTYLILQGILGSVSDIEMLILEKVLKYLNNLMTEKNIASLKKWLVMCLRIEGFDASICKTSWSTTLDCPGGDYEYIDVTMVDKNGGSMKLILDIDFKSQFQLARPSSTYTQLSNILPSIFVGCEEKLIKVISLLCSAAKQSFLERGLHIPPWRRTNYMMSKWISITPAKSSKEVSEAQNKEYSSSKFSRWAPPKINNTKRRDLGGGSGLSSQFSNMGVNCC